MDLRIFEKSPDVAPLLVRLYDSHKLYGMARDESPVARAELTGAVAELLEKDLGPRERELISDVLISLMRQAETDLRAALSERLSMLETAPLRVILHIANDDITVAKPVLNHSPVLSDLDLLYIIKGKSAAYWQEIAQRGRLSESVMNLLAETREPGTVMALAENHKIQLTNKAMTIIGAMAEGNEQLARPLLMRREVPEEISRRLYQFIGAELRVYLRDQMGLQDKEAIEAVDDVLAEFSGTQNRGFLPTPSMNAAAENLAGAGKLTTAALMDPLQRGQVSSFIALFAKFSGIAAQKIHDMLADPSGRMLAVTCRALDLSKGDFSRIYMMTQRLRSEDRIVDHKELLRALAVFETVAVDKARAMMNIQTR